MKLLKFKDFLKENDLDSTGLKRCVATDCINWSDEEKDGCSLISIVVSKIGECQYYKKSSALKENVNKPNFFSSVDKLNSKQSDKPWQLLPAIKTTNGALIVGKIFSDHYEIIDRVKKTIGIKLQLPEENYGFINHKQEFLSRGEAYDWVVENAKFIVDELNNKGFLEAVDYAEAYYNSMKK